MRLIRDFKPHVLTTYDENGGYPHPDHIQCHNISMAAFTASGDPGRYPQAGPAWQPAKLYYQGFWSRARIQSQHDWFIERGEESPFQRWFDDPEHEPQEAPFTTRIDVAPFIPQRRAALLAHATQVAPDSMWMRMPDDVLAERFPWEEFVRVESSVDPGPVDGDGWETDLFAGLRVDAASGAGRP